MPGLSERPAHLSLFSGIGGIDLAAEAAGFRTVAMCENNPFCRRVLAKHWPGVPIWEDVHDFDGRPYRGRIALVSGGFPCQPYSHMGKRAGSDDERALWPAMLRVIREVQPTWVLAENVTNFIGMGLDDACADLEDSGYQVGPITLSAASVGACHHRERLFILAHTDRHGPLRQGLSPEWGESLPLAAGSLGATGGQALPEPQHPQDRSFVYRVADGVPHRVDRSRALGNAVMPQQCYPVLREMYRLLTEEADDAQAADA